MLITNQKEYDLIWKKVYDKLKFKPSSVYRGHSLTSNLPFQIEGKYAVYSIEQMTDSQIDTMQEVIGQILAETVKEGERMYALDWQHSAFLFNPMNKEEQRSVYIEDDAAPEDGYDVYFPSFYPDGDYYFFIDEFFRFGYLGHPWRQEIWVFGDELTDKTDEVYESLGWQKII